MSVSSILLGLTGAMAEAVNTTRSRIGSLSALTTTNKTSLVAAVNELKASSGGGSSNVVIGTVQPTPATGVQVLWINTTGGNTQLILVTGD